MFPSEVNCNCGLRADFNGNNITDHKRINHKECSCVKLTDSPDLFPHYETSIMVYTTHTQYKHDYHITYGTVL